MRWMESTVGTSRLKRGSFCDQYCRIMEMQAAPQPSFGCLTKGTSNHKPASVAAVALITASVRYAVIP